MPLTFVDEADYDRIAACDEVRTEGLLDVLTSGGQGGVSVLVKTKGGDELKVRTRHTLSKGQCGFVLAGSALNLLAAKGRAMGDA